MTNWIHISDQYTLLLAGLGLITMAIFNPEGVAGAFRDSAAALRRRMSKKDETVDSTPPEINAELAS